DWSSDVCSSDLSDAECARQFIAEKTRADADPHVMPRDMAQQREHGKQRALREMPVPSRRLVREEDAAFRRQARAKLRESFALEVVEEQIRDDDLRLGQRDSEHVILHPCGFRGPRCGTRAALKI